MQLSLIAVTSRLDAVVACINVLYPMENQHCAAFKLMQTSQVWSRKNQDYSQASNS